MSAQRRQVLDEVRMMMRTHGSAVMISDLAPFLSNDVQC